MSGIPTMSGSDAKRAGGRLAAAIRLPRIRLRRWLYGALVAVTTLAGAAMMLDIMRDGGVTLLEIVILALFTATFGWIAMPFWNAVIGFVLALLRRDPLSCAPLSASGEGPPDAAAGSSRTALVIAGAQRGPRARHGPAWPPCCARSTARAVWTASTCSC